MRKEQVIRAPLLVKDAGRGQPTDGRRDPVSQPLALLQLAVGFSPARQACQTQQLRGCFRLLLTDLHEVILLPALSAIGQYNYVGLDPLLAGFQKAATHTEGFIIGVWSKNQPGSGR